MEETTAAVISEVEAPVLNTAENGFLEEPKEIAPVTTENQVVEEPKETAPDTTENGVTEEPHQNGDTKENGTTEEAKENGHVEENGVDAVESEEPAAKKVKKTPKAKDLKAGNRRSSSRLVNLDSGNKLSAEITSDNLKNLK